MCDHNDVPPILQRGSFTLTILLFKKLDKSKIIATNEDDKPMKECADYVVVDMNSTEKANELFKVVNVVANF